MPGVLWEVLAKDAQSTEAIQVAYGRWHEKGLRVQWQRFLDESISAETGLPTGRRFLFRVTSNVPGNPSEPIDLGQAWVLRKGALRLRRWSRGEDGERLLEALVDVSCARMRSPWSRQIQSQALCEHVFALAEEVGSVEELVAQLAERRAERSGLAAADTALRVVDTRTGEARVIRAPARWLASSMSIGWHPRCNVVLADNVHDPAVGAVAEHHAYYAHGGLEVYGPVRAFGREHLSGELFRIEDRPFEIGPFRLHRVAYGADAELLDERNADDGMVRIRSGEGNLVESPFQKRERLHHEELFGPPPPPRPPPGPRPPRKEEVFSPEILAIMAERQKRVDAGAPCKGCPSNEVREIACATCGTTKWAHVHEASCALHPSSVTSAIAGCPRCDGAGSTPPA